MGNPVIQVRIPAEDLARISDIAQAETTNVAAWVRSLIYAELLRRAAEPLVDGQKLLAKKPKAPDAPAWAPTEPVTEPTPMPLNVRPGRCAECGGRMGPRSGRCQACGA